MSSWILEINTSGAVAHLLGIEISNRTVWGYKCLPLSDWFSTRTS